MKKTFLLGLLLGIGGAVWLAGWYPFVDPVRLPSDSAVARNGGRTESFHIQLPDDRIARTAGQSAAVGPVPPELSLPAAAELSDVAFELFRLRNASGKVIGLGSRLRRGKNGTGYIDWTLMLPARGALFLTTAEPGPSPYAGLAGDAAASEPLVLLGDVVDGSREFEGFLGSFREEWNFNGRDSDGRMRGEIEIMTLTQKAGR